MIIAYACAVLLWLSLIAYAILGGADFGAGIWDLFSLGPHQEEKHRLIAQAVGPVWEANNVWLIYLVVGLFTAFPLATAMLATALLLPFGLALLGIVLRGAAFSFREYFSQPIAARETWGRLFGLVSLLTPFVLGCSAAAVASGAIRVFHATTQPALVSAWLTPFALVIGCMGLAICATLAPIYLTVEAQRVRNQYLAEVFRRRAFAGGAMLALTGIGGLVLAPSEAPLLWHGMLNHAIWAVAITIFIGVMTASALFWRRYRLARILIVAEVTALLGTWGLSQWPYIVPPDLTITNSASPASTLQQFFVSALLGMLVLIPSLWFLFHTFKVQERTPMLHEREIEGD
jgi:cytochrome d ubiquinol oxidase subunit II